MITGAVDATKYVDCYSAIESPQVREAFCMLIGAISTMNGHNCAPMPEAGLNRTIGIFSVADDNCPFSFAAYHDWLLFHFRLPAFKAGHCSLKTLSAQLGEVNDKIDGEWTIKLRSVDDVRRLLRLINIA